MSQIDSISIPLFLLFISKIVAYYLFLFVPKADLDAGVSSLSHYH
jgi:hypothetical protein